MVSAVHFFATKNDLEPVVEAVESKKSLRYVLMGSFEQPKIEEYRTALDIRGFGLANSGQQVQQNSYLVMDAKIKPQFREVPQRRGGLRYIVDTVANPTAIVFRHGGLFEECCLITGEISGEASSDLYPIFAYEIKQHFGKIQSYLVGPEAARLLDQGIRLTANVRASTEFDLRRGV